MISLRSLLAGFACLALLLPAASLAADKRPLVFVNHVQGSAGAASKAVTAGADELSHRFESGWQSFRTFRLVSPLQTPLPVYTGLPAENRYHRYVDDSLAQWAKALDGRFQYRFVSRPELAAIRFHWVPSFKDRMMAGETIARLEDSDIYIKTAGIPASDIHTNILHELGHALGINGHSQQPQDIMTASRKWSRDKTYQPRLSPRDIGAIQRLYGEFWAQGEDLYRHTRHTAAQ